MSPPWWRLIAALSLALACRDSVGKKTEVGHLDARWIGPDSGRISSRATAEWCADRRFLEIRAVQGDTGLALALYPADTIAAGRYRIVDPSKADSVPPSAGVALRWFEQTSIQGLQGDSGTVVLERSGSGTLSGTVEAKASSVVTVGRFSITGTFRNLRVVPQVRGCTRDSLPDSAGHRAQPPDTGVH